MCIPVLYENLLSRREFATFIFGKRIVVRLRRMYEYSLGAELILGVAKYLMKCWPL